MNKTTITLNTAVEIDGKKTKKIELNEPKAGELRGFNLADVMQLDIETICTLTPRISKLTSTHMVNMGMADLAIVSGGIAYFFAPAAKSQNE